MGSREWNRPNSRFSVVLADIMATLLVQLNSLSSGERIASFSIDFAEKSLLHRECFLEFFYISYKLFSSLGSLEFK